jgi:hypothetical protein
MDPTACLGASEERYILPLLGFKPQFLGVPACILASTLSMHFWLLHKSRTSGIVLWELPPVDSWH